MGTKLNYETTFRRILTLKMVNHKSQFGLRNRDPNELRQWRVVVRCFKCIMWVSSVKLVRNARDKLMPGRSLKNQLEIDIAFKRVQFKKDSSKGNYSCLASRSSQIIKQIKFWWMAYSTIKWHLIASLHFEKDRLSSFIRTLKNKGAPINSSCEIDGGSNSPRLYMIKLRRLLELWDWMKYLGNPFASITGAGAHGFEVMAILATMFFFYTLYFTVMNKIRADALSIIFDEEGEILRTQMELNEVFENVVKSLKNYDEFSQHETRLSDLRRRFRGQESYPRFESMWSRYNLGHKKEDAPPPNTRRHYMNRPRHDFSQAWKIDIDLEVMNDILDQMIIGKAVNPAHLEREHVKKMISHDYKVVWLFALGVVPSLVFIMGWQFIMEGAARVTRRLSTLYCSQFGPVSIPVNSDYIPLPEITNKQHADAYSKHDGSLSSLLSLFNIETYYFFNPRVALTTFELCVSVEMSMIMFFFYFMLYFHSFLDKYIWISQIERQVTNCIQLLKNLKIHRHLYDQRMMAQQEKDILKELTLAFLNYELFRRQQTSYQLLVNCCVLQAGSVLGTVLAFSYLIGSTVTNAYNSMMLFGDTYTIIFVNFLLITSSMGVNKVERTMKGLSRMIALATENSLNLTHIVGLWRRQMLTELEIREQYAPKFFGLYVTYRTLITINGYLFAVWWMLLK